MIKKPVVYFVVFLVVFPVVRRANVVFIHIEK